MRSSRPFRSPPWYRGNTTFTSEDFTEHPTVVNGMIEIYETSIRELGIDGFRIDTMKHVKR